MNGESEPSNDAGFTSKSSGFTCTCIILGVEVVLSGEADLDATGDLGGEAGAETGGEAGGVDDLIAAFLFFLFPVAVAITFNKHYYKLKPVFSTLIVESSKELTISAKFDSKFEIMRYVMNT